MTTLQSFQAEIEDIQTRELAKARGQPQSEAPRRGHLDHNKSVPKVRKKTFGSDSSTTSPISPIISKDELAQDTSDIEHSVQSALLSYNEGNTQTRDLLALLLTQRGGEHLLRLGSRPPRAPLFADEDLDSNDGWTGERRTETEIDTMIARLGQLVEEVGGKACTLIRAGEPHPRASVLLRLPPHDASHIPEVRCAVVGNVDSGKSTILGVLTRGRLDDGRGLARVALFRHKHEIESGRTSSVGMEILGFDVAGAPILPLSSGSVDPDVLRREKLGWEEISRRSAKIVTFIDLAGHERYLKTTLYGLTSGAPSCVILVIGANAGVIGMSKEHLAVALALSVPIVVCITKVDMTPPNKLEETLSQVVKILRSRGCRKNPVFVKSIEAAVEVSQIYSKEKICPIFQVSNVTGTGLNFVRTFLNLLPASEGDAERFDATEPLEFSVTDVWSVPYVGTVVNGLLNCGTVKKGDTVLFGPDSNGGYAPTVVKTMQRKRADVATAVAGQTVALALKHVPRAAVRKGMVIVHRTEVPPRAVRRFEGQVLILYHNTTMQPNYQAMLHCGAVRQTVRIVSIDHPQNLLRTGDRATVLFEFIAHPEFVKAGMKLLFREGKTKGLGVITKLF
ncbi:P-loop containing nucleoside triphosphate hydrolase protein [Multifurca ochricompacta]|uniref:P-loop containing nucleoside triphosphate hydrolase protein n=1 Tax=Multifurca ochricompacta TaxID=376703 RepID=A0AAD4M8T9_9AGAM|nr:P-loop containing nucleoside triphosphate hydrolase protein [Multifurca ochricompacta]